MVASLKIKLCSQAIIKQIDMYGNRQALIEMTIIIFFITIIFKWRHYLKIGS